MVIHFVQITTHLAHDKVRRIMEERAPRFREVPGLVQKYYGYEPSSGAFCGCALRPLAEVSRRSNCCLFTEARRR